MPKFKVCFLIIFGLLNNAGISKFAVCLEPSGQINLEFSADGHCCGHSIDHQMTKSMSNFNELNHQDFLPENSIRFQNYSQLNLLVQFYFNWVLYTLHPWPNQIAVFYKETNDAIVKNSLASSLFHRDSNILQI